MYVNRISNMPPASHRKRLIRVAKARGVIRARELSRLGIPRTYLNRLVQSGDLVRVARGLYSPAKLRSSEHHTLAEASVIAPRGVVCLLSALRFHELTTQAPAEVWIALPRSSHAPRRDYPPLRIIRMSGESMFAGSQIHQVDGIPVKVFSPSKTVADCFKFRNTVGLDVALEALREFRRARGSIDELWRHAKICRVANVLRPYLEATG